MTRQLITAAFAATCSLFFLFASPQPSQAQCYLFDWMCCRPCCPTTCSYQPVCYSAPACCSAYSAPCQSCGSACGTSGCGTSGCGTSGCGPSGCGTTTYGAGYATGYGTGYGTSDCGCGINNSAGTSFGPPQASSVLVRPSAMSIVPARQPRSISPASVRPFEVSRPIATHVPAAKTRGAIFSRENPMAVEPVHFVAQTPEPPLRERELVRISSRGPVIEGNSDWTAVAR
jgi:hypothetical protein